MPQAYRRDHGAKRSLRDRESIGVERKKRRTVESPEVESCITKDVEVASSGIQTTYQVAAKRTVRFGADSSLGPICCLLSAPSDEEPKAIVVTMYGIFTEPAGPGDKLGSGVYDKLAEILPAQGIAVLQANFRGFHPNGCGSVHKAPDAIRDVKEILDGLVSQGVCKATTPLILMGWSMGGAVAIQSAHFQSKVQNVPPLKGLVTLATQNALTPNFKDLTVPILMMHGTADRALSNACTKSLAAQARNPAIVKVVDILGDGHQLQDPTVVPTITKWIQSLI